MGKMSREEYEVMREKYQISKTYEEMKEENRGIDHPDTLSNAEATVLFIVVMIGGSIFKDRIFIWIPAIIMYFKHITRHMV